LLVRVFVLARHGQSLLNVEGTVNGDAAFDLGLSAEGIEEARALGRQISGLGVELVVVSPFPRAVQTADVALEGREVPLVVDDDLGDIRLGELEGAPVARYRAAKPHDDHSVRFPGGESLNEAAARYAQAFERVLARSEPVILVVCHELAVRYGVNAAGGSNDLDRPVHDIANATPYVFDEVGLQRAIARVRELAR
jgi:2,3-bisphosphoglycerate-dependent phosphoglycerate mutase